MNNEKVTRIVWKDEGRDAEARSFAPAYAEDFVGQIVVNYGWVTWKKASDLARILGVELHEV